MGTLYFAEVFTLIWIRIWIPTQMVSQMITVPILGQMFVPRTDVHLNFTTFQTGDQSPNPNQWKNSA